MTFKKAKLAAAMAALTIAGMGVSQNAAAYAYGYSYLDIFNFAVATSGGAVMSGGQVNGSANSQPGGTVNNCASAFGAVCNIPVVQTGSAIGDNTFSSQEGAAASFSRGDGLVPDGTQAQDLSEAKSSTNTLYSAAEQFSLSATITVTGGGTGDTVQFDFDAFLDQIAKLTGGAQLFDQANANASFNITITDPNAVQGQQIVFNWAPTGNPAANPTDWNGAQAGTTNSDAFSLQTSLPVLNADNTVTSSNTGHFSAISFDLPDGTYSLSVEKETSANAIFHTTEVPEPATAALLGLGLAGIGAARRRKART